jgi:hypothetical protein
MIEHLESAWRSARHAVELVVTDVATVAPGWVIAGVLLHVLHQVVRTRGWFNIIRAAHRTSAGCAPATSRSPTSPELGSMGWCRPGAGTW